MYERKWPLKKMLDYMKKDLTILTKWDKRGSARLSERKRGRRIGAKKFKIVAVERSAL